MPSLAILFVLEILLILFAMLQEFAKAKRTKLWFGGGGKFVF